MIEFLKSLIQKYKNHRERALFPEKEYIVEFSRTQTSCACDQRVRTQMDIMKTLFPGLSNEPIKLMSKYPAELCIKKLKEEVTDSFSLKNLTQQKPITGIVTDNSVLLSFSGRTKNSFRSTLSAKIKNHESGSIIEGQFNINKIAKILFILFGAIMAAIFISVMSIIFYAFFLYGKLPSIDLPIRALIVLIILIGIIWIGRTGTISAKNENKFIKQFLISLLDAKET